MKASPLFLMLFLSASAFQIPSASGLTLRRSDLATGAAPRSLAVADLNGDGKLDLVAANSGSNGVSVLLGNGDGSFQAAVSYATDTTPAAVVAGDFDADGKLDLAVANSGSNTVSILLGNGDGSFQPAVSYATDLLGRQLQHTAGTQSDQL
jgi:hypothetical protein